jgi:hypothetical protein
VGSNFSCNQLRKHVFIKKLAIQAIFRLPFGKGARMQEARKGDY